MDHSWFATGEGGMYFAVHTVQAPGCSARALSQVDLVFRTRRRSELLRFSGALQRHRRSWFVRFVPFRGPGSSGDWLLGECTVPGVPCVSYGELISGSTLLADVSHPGSQEDVVSNWQPAHSLVEDVVSGAEIAVAPCLPALAVTHLYLCLQGGRALNSSWLVLLRYLLGHKPLFYKCARGHHKESEPLEG